MSSRALLLFLFVASLACNRPQHDDTAETAPDKTDIPACDDLLRDLEACAAKQPEARKTYEATRDVFLGVKGDRAQLEKNCRIYRQTLKNDWGKREGCGAL